MDNPSLDARQSSTGLKASITHVSGTESLINRVRGLVAELAISIVEPESSAFSDIALITVDIDESFSARARQSV
ncbi:MAG: hypothetical protein WC829_22085, partial [Hyphomicrobium sp.]